jgi:hypothetical protein
MSRFKSIVRQALRVAAVLSLGIATTACIQSRGPILSDGRALLGDRGQIHLFDLHEGGTRNPRSYQFQWAGDRYTARGRPSADISDFTIHAHEGRDLIVQARSPKPPRPYFYALARKLTDGVYMVLTIDPNDADETARNRFCIITRDVPCRIETPEQLFALARATAAKETDQGKLAVLVRTGRN